MLKTSTGTEFRGPEAKCPCCGGRWSVGVSNFPFGKCVDAELKIDQPSYEDNGRGDGLLLDQHRGHGGVVTLEGAPYVRGVAVAADRGIGLGAREPLRVQAVAALGGRLPPGCGTIYYIKKRYID